jgi:hypothetical protein
VKRIVMFSGGAASYCAAKRTIAAHGRDSCMLLFADTLVEHPDTYRFLRDGALRLGAELVMLREGRSIWQVFKDEKFLGNSRVDPCSRILKREICGKWVRARWRPEECRLVLGFDWTELHRVERSAKSHAPYIIEAPLAERPLLAKGDMLDEIYRDGLRPPYLYSVGAPHNNCGGGCVKAGQAHFAWLLKALPCVYATWERNEEEVRRHLGRDVAILRDRTGGVVRPLTLREFRGRVAAGTVDAYDGGGCECFLEPEAESVEAGPEENS